MGVRPSRPSARGIRAVALIATFCVAMSATLADEAGAQSSRGRDLREAGVFTMTNAREGNRILAFARRADGRLTRAGSYGTGGTGSGSFEDTANGLVSGTAEGESSPNNVIDSTRLLFATNSGSDTVSVFRVSRRGLQLVDVEASGGQKPVSVTVSRGRVYVLNSGEVQDDLFDAAGNPIPNCTTGAAPSITGFRVSPSGELEPIPGSTRPLSGLGASGCAQVSFNPAGSVVVVTERLAADEGPMVPAGDEGIINTYTVNPDGTLNGPRVNEPTGEGPFGFTFTAGGALLTTEQFDGAQGTSRSHAAGYSVLPDGSLRAAGPSVANLATDTCWFVRTDDGRYGFTTSFFSGDISSFRIGRGGSLRLHRAKAADDPVDLGASDEALSHDSRYLYQLNSLRGTVNVFEVSRGGELRHLQRIGAQGPTPMGAGIGLAAS